MSLFIFIIYVYYFFYFTFITFLFCIYLKLNLNYYRICSLIQHTKLLYIYRVSTLIHTHQDKLPEQPPSYSPFHPYITKPFTQHIIKPTYFFSPTPYTSPYIPLITFIQIHSFLTYLSHSPQLSNPSHQNHIYALPPHLPTQTHHIPNQISSHSQPSHPPPITTTTTAAGKKGGVGVKGRLPGHPLMTTNNPNGASKHPNLLQQHSRLPPKSNQVAIIINIFRSNQSNWIYLSLFVMGTSLI